MNRFIYVAFSIILLFFLNNMYINSDYITVIVGSFIFPILFLFFLQRIDVFEREKFKDIFFVFMFGVVVSAILTIPYVPIRDYIVQDSPCSNVIICF